MPIEMHEVKSSLLSAIGYDADKKTLAVKFKTGIEYHYSNVEPDAFKALKSAESVGKHFGKYFRENKEKHPHKKIERKKDKT